jgi:hypothetical protein
MTTISELDHALEWKSEATDQLPNRQDRGLESASSWQIMEHSAAEPDRTEAEQTPGAFVPFVFFC